MSSRRTLLFLVLLPCLAFTLSAQQSLPAPPTPSPVAGGEAGAPPPSNPTRSGNLVRGRYLVEHVAMCIECHSTRDDAGHIIPGREYMGGNIPFRPPWPNDWASVAPRNAGLLGYDDEQAMRLLTAGAIGREGVRLRPPMPRFQMTPEDAAAVIAYMRSR